MNEYLPSYLDLFKKGILQQRSGALDAIMERCELCPRKCRINRKNGETGYCQAGYELKVSSAFPHYGEEAPLVGYNGSGTIFLTHCTLRCSFCQNYEISHLDEGNIVSTNTLAQMMISLQKRGCHNINFVTPTHYVPRIVDALQIAIKDGLKIPLVYNCGGYESLQVIRCLEDIFDLYMPDVKFADDVHALKYMNAGDYFKNLKLILKEMHRQVGILKTDESDVAYRGIIIRHLVMPDSIQGSEEIFKFITEELSRDTYVNIMNQYHPCYEAANDNIINRRISGSEYHDAVAIAQKHGLHRGF
ncbi:radical SAM protein [candidate division KSB1 bacterium]|nr:radical SAM protein [candidate division KSB1 bacterium]